jgi:hypothetical protein
VVIISPDDIYVTYALPITDLQDPLFSENLFSELRILINIEN